MRHSYNIGVAAISFSLLSFTSAMALKHSWYGELGFGLGQTGFKSNDRVRLFTAPAPGLTNGFFNRRKRDLSLMSYIGAGIKLPFKNVGVFKIGAQLSEMDYQFINGQVHPMINVGPNFDRLNYSYEGSSTLVLASVQLEKHLKGKVKGFIGALGGISWNKLHDYNESVPPGSTARPMLFPFGSRVTRQFSFGGTVGVNVALDEHISLNVAYHYINAGRARLNTTPIQTTNQRYQTKKLASHYLTIGILV